MNPIDFDGRKLLIINGNIANKRTKIIAKGVGQHDGSVFYITQENKETYYLENLSELTPIPLTSKWKKKYPNYDFYINK